VTTVRGLRSAVCSLLLPVAAALGQRVEPQGVILSEAKDLLRARSDSTSIPSEASRSLVFSLIAMPFDRQLTALVRRPALVENSTLQFGAKVFDFWGGAGVFAASGALLIAGEAGGNQRQTDMGIATGTAIIGGSLATGALKMAFGRARPYVSADSNPRDFQFGRGLRKEDYRSFPSGHSTAAFAFASAWHNELQRTGDANAERQAFYLYGLASAVAITRMYQDKHWASDVLMGAAIGILAGNLAVRNK
jgi:membrane-associated phospholipid phosphatase